MNEPEFPPGPTDSASPESGPLGADVTNEFVYFVTRMGLQALIALGLIENPVTGERRQDAAQARLVHADLVMLRDRTAGNLSSDEQEKLDEVVSTLEAQISSL